MDGRGRTGASFHASRMGTVRTVVAPWLGFRLGCLFLAPSPDSPRGAFSDIEDQIADHPIWCSRFSRYYAGRRAFPYDRAVFVYSLGGIVRRPRIFPDFYPFSGGASGRSVGVVADACLRLHALDTDDVSGECFCCIREGASASGGRPEFLALMGYREGSIERKLSHRNRTRDLWVQFRSPQA